MELNLNTLSNLTGLRMVVVRHRTIEIWNHPAMFAAPCATFPRYRGVRSPLCACRPCLDKYMEVQRGKGRMVNELDFTAINAEVVRLLAAAE